MITGVTMEETRFTDGIERLTTTASLGSVAGIDVLNINSVSDCLIFDECLKLIVTPSTEYAIESSASTLSFNAFQVLHYDSTCLDVVLDNSFADLVVHISHEQFLPAFEDFKMPLGRLCAFTLETCLESADAFKFCFDSTIELPVGCNSEFAYSDINPNNMCALLPELDVFGNKNMYEIIFTFLDDVCTARIPVNVFHEVFRDIDRYFDSAINRGNTDNAFIEFRPEIAEVVSDRYVLHSFGFPVLCNDFDCLTGQLGLEFCFGTDDVVAFIVEAFESSDMSVLESNLNRFIELDISLRNRFINWKFDSDSSFGTHNQYIEHLNLNNYLLKTAIHPTTEVMGFLADGV